MIHWKLYRSVMYFRKLICCVPLNSAYLISLSSMYYLAIQTFKNPSNSVKKGDFRGDEMNIRVTLSTINFIFRLRLILFLCLTTTVNVLSWRKTEKPCKMGAHDYIKVYYHSLSLNNHCFMRINSCCRTFRHFY